MAATRTEQTGPVLITGAARGLGAAIAVALAERGVEPVLLGRSVSSLTDTQAGVEHVLGRRPIAAEADVADWPSVTAAIDRVLAATGGRLGGVVNNAGIIDPIATVTDADPSAWAEGLRVNLLGPFHVLRACLPHLMVGSVVVNLSSGAAAAEHCGWSAYAAAKAGLERLSATLAAERPDLHVYALRPGVTDTGMQHTIRASGVDNAIRRLDPAQLQPPEIPASALARLFGDSPLRPEGCVLEAKALMAAEN